MPYHNQRERMCVALGVIILWTAVSSPGQPAVPNSARTQWNSTADTGQTEYLADDSDWWSMLRLEHSDKGILQQKREPPPGNLRILGIDLEGNGYMSQIFRKLGPTTTVQRGDAATTRAQTCYTSEAAQSNVHLIFEGGVIPESYYLFQGGPPWKGENLCAPSNLVSAGIRNEAGLGLGETHQQVMALLGKPSLNSPGRLVYIFALREKTSAKDLEEVRKAHPQMSEKELEEDFGAYDRWVEIRVRFRNSKSSYIGVLWSETN